MTYCAWNRNPGDDWWSGSCGAKGPAHPGYLEICPQCGGLIENPDPSSLIDVATREEWIEPELEDGWANVPTPTKQSVIGGATVAYFLVHE